ncbi:MAG: hypothetical protein K1X94_29140 [Sandaracinaceae bacterium]|nr:hypothetical protein [Sandaracinaceae bacterium]
MEALPFHPMVVHVPMALAVLMPLVAGGLALAWWRGWLPARAWLLAVGLQAVLLASGMAALRTGGVEEERVERVVSEALIEEHEEAAEAFVGASAFVLVLMGAAAWLGERPRALPAAIAATAGTILVLGLGVRTGHAGGSLVYEHGAASAYGDQVGTGATQARVQASDDDD